MKKLLMLTAATLVLQASPVLAGDHDGMKDHKGKMFAEHDTDGDGAISEAEFLAGAKKKFAESDAYRAIKNNNRTKISPLDLDQPSKR